MYQSYWQLHGRPFDQRAEANFFYPAESQHAALMKLRYALEHGGSAALAGPSGVGKTLLADMLARQLSEQNFVPVRIAFPLLSPAELLAYLAGELAGDQISLHQTTPATDHSLRSIQTALARLAAEGKRLLITVDDAHSIEPPATFEALRLLLNLGGDERPAPVLLLVGQTRLQQLISRMPALDERLLSKSLLASFSRDETASYVAHRLQAAGSSREIFDPSAIEAIFALTQGIPRRINRICDLALFVGFAEERPIISAEHIEAVVEDLNVAQSPSVQAEPV